MKGEVLAPKNGYYVTTAQQESDLFIESLSAPHYIENEQRGLREMIALYGWDKNIAHSVCWAESRCNPSAYNPEWHYKNGKPFCQGSFGMWQLACIHGKIADLKDPEKSTEIAYNLWRQEGWQPWSVCKGMVKCY